MDGCKFNKHELRVMIREIMREELKKHRYDLQSEETDRRIEELSRSLREEADQRGGCGGKTAIQI